MGIFNMEIFDKTYLENNFCKIDQSSINETYSDYMAIKILTERCMIKDYDIMNESSALDIIQKIISKIVEWINNIGELFAKTIRNLQKRASIINIKNKNAQENKTFKTFEDYDYANILDKLMDIIKDADHYLFISSDFNNTYYDDIKDQDNIRDKLEENYLKKIQKLFSNYNETHFKSPARHEIIEHIRGTQKVTINTQDIDVQFLLDSINKAEAELNKVKNKVVEFGNNAKKRFSDLNNKIKDSNDNEFKLKIATMSLDVSAKMNYNSAICSAIFGLLMDTITFSNRVVS